MLCAWYVSRMSLTAETDTSSDDDLPEILSSITSSQESCNSPGAFVLHDIVWAKYGRGPFWPAQIQRIDRKKRQKRYCLKFLSDPCHTLLPVMSKNIRPFSCSQRQTFLETGSSLPNFSNAVTEAEDLVNRKGLGKSFEQKDLEDEDRKLAENTSESDEEEDGPTPKKRPCPESFLRRSSRKRRQVSRYDDIVTYVREALPTLKRIYERKRPCMRHEVYSKGTAKERGRLKYQSGFGPIEDNRLQEQIMELLLSFHEKVTKEKRLSAIAYVSDVWLPEAIILSIQRKHNVTRDEAEEIYFEGSRFS